MSLLPRVAIVGRPNVGKSTLFNRLTGSRIAIVEPTPGVTRDRVSAPARIQGADGARVVELSDTGGIGIVDRDDLGPSVEREIVHALERADLILFVVDTRSGLAPFDAEVARRLRKLKKPVLLVCNKAEGDKQPTDQQIAARLPRVAERGRLWRGLSDRRRGWPDGRGLSDRRRRGFRRCGGSGLPLAFQLFLSLRRCQWFRLRKLKVWRHGQRRGKTGLRKNERGKHRADDKEINRFLHIVRSANRSAKPLCGSPKNQTYAAAMTFSAVQLWLY